MSLINLSSVCASPLMMRLQLVGLFKEYFGADLTEQTIRNNFVLMYGCVHACVSCVPCLSVR
jgi:hypothetical protein